MRRAFQAAVWVTVGEDPTEAYLREQINDVYFRLSDRRLDAQSLEQADFNTDLTSAQSMADRARYSDLYGGL